MVNFALVGCGLAGQKFKEILGRIPNTRLISVIDTNEAIAEAFAAPHNAAVFTDYRFALDDPKLDAVIIATPPRTHLEMALASFAAGKHVLVEKPFTLSAVEALQIIQAGCKSHRALGTVHPNRYYPATKLAKRLIDRGELGVISHAVATIRRFRLQEYYDDNPWRKTIGEGGDVLFNHAWHGLDLLLWWLGPVAHAFGLTGTRGHLIDVPDVAVGCLEFHNGILASIEASTNEGPEESITIIGDKARLIQGGSKQDRLVLYRRPGSSMRLCSGRRDIQWAYGEVIKEFLGQIKGGGLVSDVVHDSVALIEVLSLLK